MRLAVIGAGTMGRLYCERIARIEGLSLAGVCDTRIDRAREAAAPGGAPGFDSFKELLQQARPDVLCICLPTHLHKEWTIRAAEAGLHVICEKPMASSLEDARAMMDACNQAGVRLFVGHVVRFFPEYREAKKLIDEGGIGSVVLASLGRRGPHPGRAKTWYMDRSKSGGVALDLMIHDLDYLRFVLGEIDTVCGMEAGCGSLHYAAASLRFRSGAIAKVESVWGDPGPFRTFAHIDGSRGVIRLDSSRAASVAIRRMADGAGAGGVPQVEVPASLPDEDPYEAEIRHFTDCIRTGSEALVTEHEAYRSLAAALAVEYSARSGVVVKLPPFMDGGL